VDNGLDGFNATERMDHKAILECVDFNKKDKILEIGCGFGVLLSKIPSGVKYGIESNDFSAGKCQEKGLNVVAHDNPYKLPFEDNFFDKVVMNESIEHIEDVGKLVKEVKRILKFNGKYVVTTPNKTLFVRNLSDTHCSEMTYSELRKIIRDNDFEIVLHTVSGFGAWDWFATRFVYPVAKFFLKKGVMSGAIKKTRDNVDQSKVSNFRDKWIYLGTQQLLIAKNNK
ncbi:class I SAM-dependent methyltransferase, partial [Patescibacteria group bacterium]